MLFFILILPVLSLLALFFKDSVRVRNRVLNTLIIAGFILLLLPIAMAFSSWASSGFEGSVFSEGGSGHGTWLWFYYFVGPPGLLALASGSIIKLIIILSGYISQKTKNE